MNTYYLPIKKISFTSLIALMLFLAFRGQAQEVNYLKNSANRLDLYSLKQLKDSASGNYGEILINDIQESPVTYTDVYYNVYAKLYHEKLDIDKPSLLEELDIEVILTLNGSSTFRDTSTLSISPDQDESLLAFRFRGNTVSPYDLQNMTSASLKFLTDQISHLDDALLSSIILELYIDIGRYTTTSLSNISVELIPFDTTNPGNELKEQEALIVWQHLDKPTLYEIEWAFVPHSNPSSAGSINVDFKKYGTRVVTDQNFVPISMLYSSGFIVVRTRTKRPLLNSGHTALLNQFEYSSWSMSSQQDNYNTSNSNVLAVTNSSNSSLKNTNWQYKASYATGSKKKEVINFTDGSNRQRQSLTILNNFSGKTKYDTAQIDFVTNKSTLVAQETYYDYNGQSRLSVLPSPLLDANSIAYQKGINREGSTKVLRSNYDSLGYNHAPLLNKSFQGSAQYYSDSNRYLGTNSLVDYLPDAGGYPYRRAEYLPDGSGRLKTGYGMGADRALDDTKGTRYAYAKPTTSDLERLFGTNIGLANFYKKNIAIDPNGSMSISYIDNKGRLVASSIAGKTESRARMISIPSDSVPFTDDLMLTGAERFYESRGSYELNYPIFVTDASTYVFNYGFVINPYIECSNMDICFDCRYKLIFQVLDDENNLIVEAVDSLVNFEHLDCLEESYALDAINYEKTPATASVSGNDISIELSAQKQYTVIKKLVLLKDQLEVDAQAYIDNDVCDFLDLEHFQNLELDSANFEECQMDYSTYGPCDEIEARLRADFHFPNGTLVKNADSNDIISTTIYQNLLKISGCSNIIDSMSLNLFQHEFTAHFGLQTQPSFAEFDEEFIDFFIFFHPTYCQLTACQHYYEPRSLAFNKLLESSDSSAEFVRKARIKGFMGADDTLIFNGTDIEAKEVSPGGTITYYGDTAFLLFDETSKELFFFNGFRDYSSPFLYPPPSYEEMNLMPLRSGVAGKPNIIRSYLNNPFNLQPIPMGIEDLSNENPSMVNHEKWKLYKRFYLNAKAALFNDLLNSLVCFSGDGIGCSQPGGTYHDPSKSRGEAEDYTEYSHFTGLGLHPQTEAVEDNPYDTTFIEQTDSININKTIAKQTFALLLANGCLITDSIKLNYDSLEFEYEIDTLQVNKLLLQYNSTYHKIDSFKIKLESTDSIGNDTIRFMLSSNEIISDVFSISASLFDLERDSLVVLSDSNGLVSEIYEYTVDPVAFISSFNATAFFCDPFSYLESSMSSHITCNPRTINFSPIITPYKSYGRDDSNNPLFNCPQDILTAYHCEDYNDAHADYVTTFSSSGVPLIDSLKPLDIEDSLQRQYANWMNNYLGLNLGFQHYYDFAAECSYNEDTTAFGKVLDWEETTKLEAIKTALVDSGSVYYKEISNEAIFQKLNIALGGTAYAVDTASDFIGFGEIDMASNQNFLYYLENQKSRYDKLLDSLNWVYTAIRDSVKLLYDIEDTLLVSCDSVSMDQYATIPNMSNVIIDRVYRYYNGTIWARLLNAADSSFYNDYYYYYGRCNGDYYLSEVDSFITISPVYDQEEMHFVKLRLDSLDAYLLASTSAKIAQAERLNGIVLTDLKGHGDYPRTETCEDLKYWTAKINAEVRYKEYIDGIKDTFKLNYTNFCLNQQIGNHAFIDQYLTMDYVSREHHFTLYHYDQADNLVMTVPPDGVDTDFIYDNPVKQSISQYRNGNPLEIKPSHAKKTIYKYNAQNDIIRQITPNGGMTYFWYDRAGRPVLTQNEEQREVNKYSYNRYDGQSRVFEVGEVTLDTLSGMDWSEIHAFVILDILDSSPMTLDSLISLKTRNDVVITFYDEEILSPNHGIKQNNLRSRVSTSAYYHRYDNSTIDSEWEYATHYSYDATGNVKHLINDYYQAGTIDNVGSRFKRIDYVYDLISGNVIEVYYQLGFEDAFYHRYEYDAENRIQKVETSNDGIIWDEDASYEYYPHGILARTEIGNQKVQGLDYAYTLEGYLKSINSAHKNDDMGKDAAKSNIYGADAFGMALEYNMNDYTSISVQNDHLIASVLGDSLSQLYNGNIGAISQHNQSTSYGKTYRYDQLNRLRHMDERSIDDVSLGWGTALPEANSSAYEYDRNGNLTELQRIDGESGNMMDNFTYNYISGTDQLSSVDDQVDAADFSNDIDQQGANNYAYDKIGNLIVDSAESICQIQWYPNGKVKRITRDKPIRQKANLFFDYDPMGNRTKKEVSFVEDGKLLIRTTYYSRDAQGNVMATYEERDCQYHEGEDSLGLFHYQYSHTFGHYTQEAINQVGQSTVLTYLSNTFEQKDELMEEATTTMDQIPNIKDTIVDVMNVANYFSLYPDAGERVLEQNPYFYANYLFNNHNSTFTSLMNDKYEAWIQYFESNNKVSDFYSDIDSLYTAYYGTNTSASKFFDMNQDVGSEHLMNYSFMSGMTDLTVGDYTTIANMFGNQYSRMTNMQTWMQNLQGHLASYNPGPPVPNLINKINAALVVLNYTAGAEMATIFQSINPSIFYTALGWLPAAQRDRLNSILYHFYFIDPTYINQGSLNAYQPSAVFNWANDTNGDLIQYFLHDDIADPGVFVIFPNYLSPLNLNNSDIYFPTGSTVRPFVDDALVRNASHATVISAMTSNNSTTSNALRQTESLAQLVHYFKTYHADLIIEQNYYYDSLSTALSGLYHITPYDYADTLSDDLPGVTFAPISSCTPQQVYLLPEQFSIFGSKRLGTMDAKIKRKDEDNLYSRKLGAKSYELIDHLGNVVATVSDKKLHPQELVINGSQDVDTSLGFQADVTGRYDYYPFGMEIMSRSGDFTTKDYTTDITKLIYQGLLTKCSYYNASPSGSTDHTCSTQTNLYGQAYVDGLIEFGFGTLGSYLNTNDSIQLNVELKLSSVIPNIDTSSYYRFEFYVDQTKDRDVIGKVHHSGGTEEAMAPESQLVDEKTVILEFIGAEWESYTDVNGNLDIELSFSEAHTSGSFHKTQLLEDIKIYKIDKNTLVPYAMRTDDAYTYGFNGMEREGRVSGSGNHYTTFYRPYDPRLGRWWGLDPAEAKYPDQSPYAFSFNNPINLNDPLGDDPCGEGGKCKVESKNRGKKQKLRIKINFRRKKTNKQKDEPLTLVGSNLPIVGTKEEKSKQSKSTFKKGTITDIKLSANNDDKNADRFKIIAGSGDEEEVLFDSKRGPHKNLEIEEVKDINFDFDKRKKIRIEVSNDKMIKNNPKAFYFKIKIETDTKSKPRRRKPFIQIFRYGT